METHAVLATLAASLAAALPAFGQCETDKLLASNGSPSDFFGTEVDVCGDVAVVGGFFANAAWVFRFDGSDWIEEAVLVADDAVPTDLFGKTAAIHGDVAVVGAPSDADNGGGSGSAYIFRYDPASSTWRREAKLLASDGGPSEHFGWSVAISGDTVLAGAIGVDNDDDTGGGAAYVFRFDGEDWVEEAKLLTTDTTGSDFTGWAVAIDGDVAMLGAFGDDDNGFASGSAYVFRHDGTRWIEEAEFLDENGAKLDNFGRSVAIRGDVAVVGSPDDGPGSAFVFRFDGRSWTQEAHLVPSDAGRGVEGFGVSVSVDGDVVIVGAPGDNNDNGTDAGAMYLFRRVGSRWLEIAKLVASDGAAHDTYGMWVAIDGDVGIVGSDSDDDGGDGAGSAYMFAGLTGIDCNANEIPDGCDLDAGTSPDADGNGVPDECDCPWDLDGNAETDVEDLIALILAWGQTPAGPPDFDGDGTVNAADLIALVFNWGPCG